jgi:GMP synthase-like glutamine amidotransferase
MNISPSLQLDLEDLLADLRHARRSGDLGRMALLCYCEVRRWARKAGQSELAAVSAAMVTGSPHASRQAFLEDMDKLEQRLQALQAASVPAAPAAEPRLAPAAATN